MSLSAQVPVRAFLIAGISAALVAAAVAQGTRPDVHFVPTPPEVVDRMLRMAEVGPNDFVIDLGSGDGRIPIAAVKDHKAKRALGVDIDPQRIKEANANAKAAGVTDKVTFRQENLFETDIREATVITMYLLSSLNLRLRPRLLEQLRPGTRLASHAFDMGDWKPDAQDVVGGRQVFFWVVPAKVEGRWQLSAGERKIELALKQSFQEVTGTATMNGREVPLRDVRLRGDQLQFVLQTGEGQLNLRGKVDGEQIQLRAAPGDGPPEWRGRRTARPT
jgi:protein-L-isoaspartate O-methyltransferase